MMGLKEEVIEMQKELEEVKSENFAMELLGDLKKANKRMFIIWLVTFISFLTLLGYTIWLLNDIEYTEETIEIQDVENVENSDIQIGDR